MSRSLMIRALPLAAAILYLPALTSAQSAVERLTPQERSPSPVEDELLRLRAAAEEGSARAQNTLGEMYARGTRLTRDPAQAVDWYRKAAEQGYADAQFNLGDAYANGIGVKPDPSQAVSWFRKAAEQGHTTAQLHLALLTYAGVGGPPDFVEAYKWFDAGWTRAENKELYAAGRDALAKKMTPAQIAEAQTQARQ
jgi:TPR repeat protein